MFFVHPRRTYPQPKWPVRRSDATQSRRPIDCAGDGTVTFRSSFSVERWHRVIGSGSQCPGADCGWQW